MNNSYSRRFAESIVDTVLEALLVLDGDLRVVFANRSFYKKFQVSREETEGRCVYRLGNGQWDIPDLRHLLSDVISGHRLVEDFQVKHVFERLGERVMLLSARLLETQVKEESFILLAVEDITDKHESAQKLRASEEMYRKFVEDINSIIIGFNRKGVITFFNSFAEKIFGYNRNEVIGKRSFVGTVVPEFDSSGNDNSDLVEELFSNPSGHYANESEGVCRDGSRIWFTWNLKVTYDGSGEGEEILIDGNDITELRKTRRQLEKKTATLDALLEFIPEGIMVSDENHMIRSVSKRMGEVLGVSVEDVLRTNEPARLELLDLYWPDGRRLVPDEHPLSKSVITGEQYLNYEVFQKQDGKTRIFSINASPIRDTRGNVTGAIGAWRDITELRTSLAVAEERRRVLDVIMEFSPVGIMLVDKTGRIVEANRLQSQYLQMSVEDIVGTEEQPDVWGILDPSTRKPPHYHFLPLCRAIREKKIVSEKEYLLVRSGNERLFALSAAPIFDEKQNLTGAITVWREITEQKKTEQQLRRSELQFRRMFEYHRAIMLLIDPNTGIIIDANDSAVRFYGYSREELRLMNINDLNQLSREQVVEEMQRALFEQRDHFIFPHKLSDGELRWVEVYSSPVQTENRQLLFSIIHDITERRKTEEALRESEERFRGIFDNAALGIVEADRDGHFIAVNEQLCQILGYTREQLLKYNVYDLTAPEDREKSNRINARLHEGVFRKYSYEKRYLKGDGSRLWVHVTVSSIYDSRNRRIGSVNTIEDISARKKIESALRGSEERFRTLADNISQLVWMATPEGEIFWFNKRWYDFTSTSLEIMKAEGLKKVIHPDFIERATTTFQESIESGKIWEFTFPMRKGDGTYRWFLSRANPIRDDAGRITRWFGTNTDISEIKRVQEELNVAAERFKRIASSNIVGVIIAGSDGSISFANDYFLNVIGYSREDFEQGRISWKEITPREFAHLDEHAIEQLQETGVAIPYEKQFMRKDGSRVWVLLADTMLPGPESEILAFVLDVTERRSALDEAEARRAEVEAILDSLPDGYILYDQNGSVVSMNDRARTVIGFTDEDMKRPYEERIKDLKILSPEGKEYLVDKMPSYRAIKYGETTRDVIMDIVRPDREYWISVSASPISANGRRLGAVMEFSDITNLRRIQEQLTGERNFVNAILDTSGAMILISDRNGRIIRFNKACEELTGFSAEELKGHSIYDLVPEDELSDVKKVVTERLLDGEKMVEHENHWITKSGERKFIRWRNTSLPDDQRNTPLIVATGIDISDRKHFENELTATNRELESFSYSVSHDLRSPLAVIGNFAAILLEDYAESLDEEGQDYLGRMIINVKKMQKLIDDILRLSRVSRQEVKREDVDLSSIVRGYLEELHSAEPKRRAEFSVQENVYASADPQLVHVALENILRNSWKYCSKRETTRVEFGAELHDGNTVYFVKDNGVGFDSEYAETIFEPFKRVHAEQEFTGTGVGLSIVKRVIDRHEGRVWAKGKVGEGAEFYFTLG